MEDQIKHIQKQVTLLKVYAGLITAVLIGFFYVSNQRNEPGIIRTKGIIVEDSTGKERILIGAPFPESKFRIRTDFEKSKAAWGERFGGNFDWYKTNEHITNDGAGILILDENGHDRVALGSPVPSSFIGRIADAHGISVNDERGIERGGYGLLRGGEINRMVLGLDHISGYEGAMMAVWEDGSVNITFNDPNNTNRLHLTNDKGDISKFYEFSEKYTGLILKDSTGKIISKFSNPGEVVR